MSDEILTARLTEQYARQRLDAVLVELFPDYSRNRLQQWIKSGKVLVNGKESKPKDKMLGDEIIEMHLDSEPLDRSEEHTSELQSLRHLVCRLLLEKKKKKKNKTKKKKNKTKKKKKTKQKKKKTKAPSCI